MNIHHLTICGLLLLSLAGCGKVGENLATPVVGSTEQVELQFSNTESIEGESSVMLKLQDIVPQGYRLLDSKEGDIDHDGIADALLVVEDEFNTSQVFGEGAQRKMLVCKAGEDGVLKVVRENRQIIPCKTCGGLDGAYFELQIVQPGAFSVVVQGGSRERWTIQYDFTYDKLSSDWLLTAAKISLMDSTQEDVEPTVRYVSVSELAERSFSKVNDEVFPEISAADEN